MKKSVKIVTIACVLMIVALAVLVLVYNRDVKERKELERSLMFLIKTESTSANITLDALKAVPSEEFTAVLDTSSTEPKEITLRGVEVVELCAALGIDIEDAEVFEFKALDSYASAVTIEEVTEENNVYICYEMEGQPLKPKSEGGMGPFLMVIRSSVYSQRWCKYLMEIDIR